MKLIVSLCSTNYHFLLSEQLLRFSMTLISGCHEERPTSSSAEFTFPTKLHWKSAHFQTRAAFPGDLLFATLKHCTHRYCGYNIKHRATLHCHREMCTDSELQRAWWGLCICRMIQSRKLLTFPAMRAFLHIFVSCAFLRQIPCNYPYKREEKNDIELEEVKIMT